MNPIENVRSSLTNCFEKQQLLLNGVQMMAKPYTHSYSASFYVTVLDFDRESSVSRHF